MYQNYVYIMSNNNNTTLYVGVTNDLIRRVYAHKQNLLEDFTKRYNLHKLIYFEHFNNIEDAIKREKFIKKLTASIKNN